MLTVSPQALASPQPCSFLVDSGPPDFSVTCTRVFVFTRVCRLAELHRPPHGGKSAVRREPGGGGAHEAPLTPRKIRDLEAKQPRVALQDSLQCSVCCVPCFFLHRLCCDPLGVVTHAVTTKIVPSPPQQTGVLGDGAFYASHTHHQLLQHTKSVWKHVYDWQSRCGSGCSAGDDQ